MRRFHDVSTSLGGREITLMQQQHTDLCWLERQVPISAASLLYYKPTETSSQSILLDGREYYRNPIFRSSRRLGKTQILSTACLRHPITLFALGSFASFE